MLELVFLIKMTVTGTREYIGLSLYILEFCGKSDFSNVHKSTTAIPGYVFVLELCNSNGTVTGTVLGFRLGPLVLVLLF